MLTFRYLPLCLISCCIRKQHNSPKKQGLQTFFEPYKIDCKSVQKIVRKKEEKRRKRKKKEEKKKKKEAKRRKKKEKMEKIKQVLFSDVAPPNYIAAARFNRAIYSKCQFLNLKIDLLLHFLE